MEFYVFEVYNYNKFNKNTQILLCTFIEIKSTKIKKSLLFSTCFVSLIHSVVSTVTINIAFKILFIASQIRHFSSLSPEKFTLILMRLTFTIKAISL